MSSSVQVHHSFQWKNIFVWQKDQWCTQCHACWMIKWSIFEVYSFASFDHDEFNFFKYSKRYTNHKNTKFWQEIILVLSIYTFYENYYYYYYYYLVKTNGNMIKLNENNRKNAKTVIKLVYDLALHFLFYSKQLLVKKLNSFFFFVIILHLDIWNKKKCYKKYYFFEPFHFAKMKKK